MGVYTSPMTSLRRLRRRTMSVMVATALLGGCGAADDVARNIDGVALLARGAGDDGVRLGDDIARRLPVGQAETVAGRVERLVDEAAADPAVRDGLRELLWDVACDVITGNIPRDDTAVSDWLAQRAFDFGVTFVDGGAGYLAGALLDALEDDSSDASDACSLLGDLGL